jgi:hypothetical protein
VFLHTVAFVLNSKIKVGKKDNFGLKMYLLAPNRLNINCRWERRTFNYILDTNLWSKVSICKKWQKDKLRNAWLHYCNSCVQIFWRLTHQSIATIISQIELWICIEPRSFLPLFSMVIDPVLWSSFVKKKIKVSLLIFGSNLTI